MKSSPEELVIVGVILGIFGLMIGWAVWFAKGAAARVARKRVAARLEIALPSSARIVAVLIAGTILAGAVPGVMSVTLGRGYALLATLSGIFLAFAAVVAPFTIARRFTTNRRLVLDPRELRLEQEAGTIAIDLGRKFELATRKLDDEVVVLVTQQQVRLLFGYREGPQFVTLPLERPDVESTDQWSHFGPDAAIIYERLRERSDSTA